MVVSSSVFGEITLTSLYAVDAERDVDVATRGVRGRAARVGSRRRSSASTRDRCGAWRARATATPHPSRPVGPIPTWAVTVESAASRVRPWATASSSEWKQAAYPTAQSCSGLAPGPPSPPNAFGTDSSTARRPSKVLPRPARPPSTIASVVYKTFISAPLLYLEDQTVLCGSDHGRLGGLMLRHRAE